MRIVSLNWTTVPLQAMLQCLIFLNRTSSSFPRQSLVTFKYQIRRKKIKFSYEIVRSFFPILSLKHTQKKRRLAAINKLSCHANLIRVLTKYSTILKPQKPLLGTLVVVQKHWSTEFWALKLGKFRSGCGIFHFTISDRVAAPITILASRPTLSQFWSFKIWRTTTLKYEKFVEALKMWKGPSCSFW